MNSGSVISCWCEHTVWLSAALIWAPICPPNFPINSSDVIEGASWTIWQVWSFALSQRLAFFACLSHFVLCLSCLMLLIHCYVLLMAFLHILLTFVVLLLLSFCPPRHFQASLISPVWHPQRPHEWRHASMTLGPICVLTDLWCS